MHRIQLTSSVSLRGGYQYGHEAMFLVIHELQSGETCHIQDQQLRRRYDRKPESC